MGLAHYIIDSRRCPDCTYRRDEYRHFKNCIPKRYWPPESEWRDFMPVPVKVPAMVGKYPRAVYEAAFPTVLSRPVEPVVDNQTVYLEPEPLDEVTVPGAGRFDADEPRLRGMTQAEVNAYPGNFVNVAPTLTCPTCGKVCKHAGALSGHMRSHKGGS